MRQLNSLVEGELRDVKELVSEFSKAKGLAESSSVVFVSPYPMDDLFW